MTNNSIAALSENARVSTTIFFDTISVVAFFEVIVFFTGVCSNEAVAAGSYLAVVQTVIEVRRVSVIATFIAVFILVEVGTYDEVAASRRSAMITTAVGIDLVTIIAGLAWVNLTVATRRQNTAGTRSANLSTRYRRRSFESRKFRRNACDLVACGPRVRAKLNPEGS